MRGGNVIITKINAKFQVTIPKEIRTKMKMLKNDSILWNIEGNKIVIRPVKKSFLKYRGYIKVGKGYIDQDIAKTRTYIAKKVEGKFHSNR